MTPANPTSARVREIREAIAGGLPSAQVAAMIRDLLRQVQALFETARRGPRVENDGPPGETGDAADFVLDMLSRLGDSPPRSSPAKVLSDLAFVERILRIQETCGPPDGRAGSAGEAGALPRRAPASRGRGLVVDDEHTSRLVVGAWLRDAGIEVTEAARADDARRLLGEGRWDLIFADVILPGGGDGYDLAAQALQSNISIGVVFATGYEYAHRPCPLELRSWPMLHKPFTRAGLLDALERATAMTTPATGPSHPRAPRVSPA